MAKGYTGPARRQVSRTKTIGAPVGGLNAVDSLANMPETDAIILDNWFPEPSFVSVRGGYSQWATGFPGWVETILPYSNASGSKLFGISGTSVYDATAGGAIGAAVVTGLTNARWEWTNVATAGGQYLYAANAVDKPLLYDGTTWVKVDGASTPAITGVTTTKLRNPVVWKNRVWFVEDGSMRAWYLPTASIGGAASSFDFGPLFRLGGQLHVIFTASLTDGSTFDDYIFFMSTMGEILMYRGTDPATPGLFVLNGIYRVGPPVGRRCWFKFGEDSVIICGDGFVSLQKTIAIGRVNQKDTISYKILNAVNEAVQKYRANFGWQGILHPIGNKIIINVPVTQNSSQFQFVMNTINFSWCTFGNISSPWNAATFEVQGNNLYFGGSTYIALADSGQADNGAAIAASVKPAFSYFKTDRQKFVKMIRPMLNVDFPVQTALAINVDYQADPPSFSGSYTPAVGSPWDTSAWDTSPWVSGSQIQSEWETVDGIGFAITMYMRTTLANGGMDFIAVDYLYEIGGVL